MTFVFWGCDIDWWDIFSLLFSCNKRRSSFTLPHPSPHVGSGRVGPVRFSPVDGVSYLVGWGRRSTYTTPTRMCRGMPVLIAGTHYFSSISRYHILIATKGRELVKAVYEYRKEKTRNHVRRTTKTQKKNKKKPSKVPKKRRPRPIVELPRSEFPHVFLRQNINSSKAVVPTTVSIDSTRSQFHVAFHVQSVVYRVPSSNEAHFPRKI